MTIPTKISSDTWIQVKLSKVMQLTHTISLIWVRMVQSISRVISSIWIWVFCKKAADFWHHSLPGKVLMKLEWEDLGALMAVLQQLMPYKFWKRLFQQIEIQYYLKNKMVCCRSRGVKIYHLCLYTRCKILAGQIINICHIENKLTSLKLKRQKTRILRSSISGNLNATIVHLRKVWKLISIRRNLRYTGHF